MNIMDSVKVYDKTFVPFIKYEVLMKDVDAVAERLNADYAGGGDIPIILCVLNGAMMFTAELMKRLTFDCELMSIKIKSYSGDHSTGEVKQTLGLTSDITGRRIIIVEDIVDTGFSMMYLTEYLKQKGAKDTKICTMLFKPDTYDKPLKIDYIARNIPSKFILGFGLDYDELGRQYKDIYVLED